MKSIVAIKLSEIKKLTIHYYKVILYLDRDMEATKIKVIESLETTKQRLMQFVMNCN